MAQPQGWPLPMKIDRLEAQWTARAGGATRPPRALEPISHLPSTHGPTDRPRRPSSKRWSSSAVPRGGRLLGDTPRRIRDRLGHAPRDRPVPCAQGKCGRGGTRSPKRDPRAEANHRHYTQRVGRRKRNARPAHAKAQAARERERTESSALRSTLVRERTQLRDRGLFGQNL